MKGVLLLAVLSALPPSCRAVELSTAAVAAGIPDPTVRDLYVRLCALKADGEAELAQLLEIRKELDAGADPATFAERRVPVREALRRTYEETVPLREKFIATSRTAALTLMLKAAARGVDGVRMSEGQYAMAEPVKDFGNMMRVHTQVWDEVLRTEDASFTAAKRRVKQEEKGRARRRKAMAGVAALLAAAAAVWFFRRRTGAPPELPYEGAVAEGPSSSWEFGRQWRVRRAGGKPGVVRLLSAEISSVGQGAERMAGLVRAATAFRHPGVQEVYEVGVSPEGVYLLAQRPSGRPLSELLASGKAFGAEAALAAMAPAARALDAAHAAGAAHGSLTPERILILPDGSAQLADFGLARALATRPALRSKAFSPAYAAPEVLEGKITLPSDLFAFGVILYEMLFVRLPFEGTNLAVLKQERRFPKPSALLGRPAPQTDAFFAALLEPAARQRRPEPGGLRAALSALDELMS